MAKFQPYIGVDIFPKSIDSNRYCNNYCHIPPTNDNNNCTVIALSEVLGIPYEKASTFMAVRGKRKKNSGMLDSEIHQA